MKKQTGRHASTVDSVEMSPERIAEKAMPGWKAVSEAVSDAPQAVESDAQLPDLHTLREKYFGSDSNSDAAAVKDATDNPGHTEIVTLESGQLKRKVGVNTKKGVVTWRQG